MIIELTKEEFDLYQTWRTKNKPHESFIEAIKTDSIENLIGLKFPDQEGLFIGMMNNIYYFVESTNWVCYETWKISVRSKRLSAFHIPTKEEMMVLYANKEKFNSNCPEDEKIHDYWHWTSSEHCHSTAWSVNFNDGKIDCNDKSNLYYARGIREVIFNH